MKVNATIIDLKTWIIKSRLELSTFSDLIGRLIGNCLRVGRQYQYFCTGVYYPRQSKYQAVRKNKTRQNRRGKGSRLIISATPSLQTFPQARHKSSCGWRNAPAAEPLMIEGLLACSRS